MQRLTPIPWKTMECVVLRAGFVFSRQEGSHRIYTREGTARPVVIPAHHKPLAVSVVQGLMRTAGLDRDAFLGLLQDC